MIEIYVDGSSKGNPGKGGYGIVVMQNNNLIKAESYPLAMTTNNQAELKGILRALELSQTEYKKELCLIYSDSSYCVNICNDWIFKWAGNSWVRGKNEEIKNLELVQLIYKYLIMDFPNFQIVKVKGHADILPNELADAAATLNRNKFFKLSGIEIHIEEQS